MPLRSRNDEPTTVLPAEPPQSPPVKRKTMSVVAFPGWVLERARQWPLWLTLPAAGVVVLLGLVLLNSSKAAPIKLPPGQLHVASLVDPFEVRIKKDGELQAVKNIDITCQVEGTTTITEIVKEGVMVEKGQVLLVLDSAQITQRLEDCTLDLQKAEADLTNAREMREIQVSKNAADIEAADVALELAKLDELKYTQGTYPQDLVNARTELEMAEITLKNRQDDLAQMKKLYAKDFVTSADMKKAELDVMNARNALDKATTALKVISEYSHQMDLTNKRSSLLQAEQRLQRTKRENIANLAWRTADVSAKEQALTVIKRRYERLKQQLANTTITAPEDGIVIYGSTGDRNNQNPIQEGATVRERQLLLRLPDTSQMKVVVRINESVVSQLAEGQDASVRISGVPRPVRATVSKISPVADSANRWWNPDLREYPVDLVLSETPKNLKPGMGASAEILVTSQPSTLAAPMDTIYSAAGKRYAFVYDGAAIQHREVTTGLTNEQLVELKSGVEEGATLVRLQAGQGRELLERAGVKVTPATQPSRRSGGRRENGAPGENGAAPGSVRPTADPSLPVEKPSEPKAPAAPAAVGQAAAKS
jgi:RND family efflux transporter MFP subunit